ncbi:MULTISPECIES: 4Fe-4S dicluster domain-containing protein [Shewanella]|uniref:Carbon-monoxide dehydrogenase iron sulfur subunit n=1 Tax=Shewanella fodinae TaxID=552357 RepID=A0A4R2F5A7_9GAMM|nr:MULTISPECIES: 4Fe-4S dicluster domain-containing protein [Shewanella]MBO1273488.1 4Fe-4S dicluster domain-containing protein [Shewanella sp. 4t3-1-2LB]TCN77002.1 carbon-monoxide dehydrogenase iron sulfur subunit [Shewanella fodinae]
MKELENVIIYADAQKCLGCHSCELACAVAHGGTGGLVSAVINKQPLHSRTKVVLADGVVMPMQCRQCDNAPCAMVCPTGACRQQDGKVLIEEKNCVGCKLCIMVCPFGAISVRRDGIKDDETSTNQGVALKCDLCTSWCADNNQQQTACVQACPTKAIRLVNMGDYRKALIQARAKELALSHKHMNLTLRK